jgi:hypothetical protein
LCSFPARLNAALEVVPSQTLSTLQRAYLSFVLHRLVLRFSVKGAACFFWVRHTPVAVLSAHSYHALLLNHFFYASVFFVRACCYARSLHWQQALSNPAFQRIGA